VERDVNGAFLDYASRSRGPGSKTQLVTTVNSTRDRGGIG
jgi:hypothetical protein